VHNQCQVYVTPYGSKEMVPALPVIASISALNDYFEIGIGELGATGYRQSPPMQTVKDVGIPGRFLKQTKPDAAPVRLQPGHALLRQEWKSSRNQDTMPFHIGHNLQ
jgi:hypothetical protein